MDKQLEKYWQKAQPYWDKVEPVARATYPHVVKACAKTQEFYQLIVEPWLQTEMATLTFAVILVLFGGSFALTIACYQAFRIAAYGNLKKAWAQLSDEYDSAMENLQKDPEAKALLDKDGDGKVDIWEVRDAVHKAAMAKSKADQAQAMQTVSLMMRCVNPNTIIDASVAFWTGIVAVLATLRSQLAHSVAVGAQIGDRVADVLKDTITPFLHKRYPKHKEWMDAMLRTFCAGLGVFVALMLVRMVSAFNAALQGATIIVKYLLKEGEKHNWPQLKDVKFESQMGQIYVWAIVLTGFLWQLQSGFSTGVFGYFLFPALIVESFLGVLASV